MLRDYNIKQIRKECDARNIQYDQTTNCMSLLNLIKQDEGGQT